MSAKAQQIVQNWLEQWVIALNLCPFAKHPYLKGLVRVVICEDADENGIFRFVLAELDNLIQNRPSEIETTVIGIENGLKDFDEYLNLLDQLEAILPQTGLEGVIQIASFHPDYCFDGVSENDVSNYTNRSPYPLFHLIREDSVEKALEFYSEPEKIPMANVKLMQDMGEENIHKMLKGMYTIVRG